MARQEVILYNDDITGVELNPEDVRTLTITIEGTDLRKVSYRLDLSEETFTKTVGDLKELGAKGMNVTNLDGKAMTRRARSLKGTEGIDPKDVRQWAWDRGLKVAAKGKLPADILEQYKAAVSN